MALVGLAWGARLGYEYSGKLLSITFLIVAPAGLKEGSGLHVALSRAGGIIVGILLTFLLSCSWFPRSASGQVVDHLHNSLEALHQLTALTWSGLIPHDPNQEDTAQEDTAKAAAAAAAAAAAGASAAPEGPTAVPGLSQEQRLELRRRIDDQCEDALFRCTQQALAAGDALKTAESELYAGTAWGYRLYLPLLLLGKRSRRRFHLPRDLVAQLRLCVRRLARITWSLHTIIQEGFDAQMMVVVAQRYPPGLLQQLQDSSAAFVGDVLAALPPGSSRLAPAAAAAAAAALAAKVPQHNLLRFQQALHTLQEISELQRMQLIDHMRRYNQPPPPSQCNMHSASSIHAAAAAGQPHVDTPRLFFADTSDGYVAKLRWYSFQFLLEQLAEGYSELAGTLNSLLPLLPGAEHRLAG
ncbi:hypothetical protein OEZ85_000148 [Tetradesmus obliquus]|uniref:DUF2421 domain-containing protein n=1 Tax=Tetradesmus obliquus TaxID=3088 RepID=A0ABY8UR25_TETOB|nr:hypothetical protein OEZ85_000148 [Tetradesmus obliquus]